MNRSKGTMKPEPPESSPRPRWKQWLIEVLDLSSQSPNDLLDEIQRVNDKNILQDDVVNMLQGVMKFSTLQVQDVMVPRSQIQFIYHDDDFDTILARIAEFEHSRYPVVDNDRDDLIGILLAKDLLRYIGNRDAFDIDDIIRPALLVPESQRLDRLLTEFRNSRNHMALVLDEYAGVAGLVTFEDVLEQIVGDIDDEYDEEDEDAGIHQNGDDSYLIQATTPLAEVNEALGTRFESEEFDTIAGLVINRLGRIPRQGEELFLAGFIFRILRSDNRRILQLEALRMGADEYAQAAA